VSEQIYEIIDFCSQVLTKHPRWKRKKEGKLQRYPVVKANCIAEKKTDFGSFLSKLATLKSESNSLF
jgi:hypothetical protein